MESKCPDKTLYLQDDVKNSLSTLEGTFSLDAVIRVFIICYVQPTKSKY